VSVRRRRLLEEAYTELKWRQYAQNPSLFFSECVKIPAGNNLNSLNGRAPFELFDYQQQTLDTIINNRYVIVLKARQLGLTTLMMAYAFWMIMFRPGSNIVLVSRSQTAANSALEIVNFMYNFLPEWVKVRGPKMEADAATHHLYRFNDGMMSQITSYAATRTVAAGQTASLVLWDEAALAEYQDDALRTLLPTTDAGGSMVIFSTARGGHNAFARLYKDAEAKENAFVPVFHPWHVSRFMNPAVKQGEIDESQYESKKRAMSNEPWRFYAEYPSSSEQAFRQSGRSRFPGLPDVEEFEEFPLRGKMVSDNFGAAIFEENENGPLWMREEATLGVPEGCKPVVSVDPSGGSGGDYTVMTAGWVDREGIPQRMAFWRSNVIEPSEYSVDAYLLGNFFSEQNGRQALMVVERQGGYGETVIHVLRQMRYMNLYVHKYSGHRRYRQDTSFGFPMTATRRPLVVDALGGWLDFENGMVMGGIDSELRRELGAFVVKEDGKVGADVGMNDDIVMSTAIFVYVAEENTPKATIDSIVEQEEDTFTVDVSHIFKEAEQIRRMQNREDRMALRKEIRRERRQMAWR